jgi:protein-tyrosine-phosphatase
MAEAVLRERAGDRFEVASAAGSDGERLAVLRRVRDEIRDRIEAWLRPNPARRR